MHVLFNQIYISNQYAPEQGSIVHPGPLQENLLVLSQNILVDHVMTPSVGIISLCLLFAAQQPVLNNWKYSKTLIRMTILF